MKQTNTLKKTALAGLTALVLGGALSLPIIDSRRKPQSNQTSQEQEDLLAVDRYIHAIENPDAFDGWYTLGWNMQIPQRYENFVKEYSASK